MGRRIALLFHDRGTRRGWVVSSTPRPQFTPRKEPVPILQEAGWAPGPVWTGGKSRLHRDSIPDRPARIQSVYRLSYPAHHHIWHDSKNTHLTPARRRIGGVEAQLHPHTHTHTHWLHIFLTSTLFGLVWSIILNAQPLFSRNLTPGNWLYAAEGLGLPEEQVKSFQQLVQNRRWSGSYSNLASSILKTVARSFGER